MCPWKSILNGLVSKDATPPEIGHDEKSLRRLVMDLVHDRHERSMSPLETASIWKGASIQSCILVFKKLSEDWRSSMLASALPSAVEPPSRSAQLIKLEIGITPVEYGVTKHKASCSSDGDRRYVEVENWLWGMFLYYIIYTPNLGFPIAIFDREREQGRFRGSSEGARGSIEGARGSIEGARGSNEEAGESREGAWGPNEGAEGRSKRGEVLAPRWAWFGCTLLGYSCFYYLLRSVASLSLLLPRLLQLRTLLASSSSNETLFDEVMALAPTSASGCCTLQL